MNLGADQLAWGIFLAGVIPALFLVLLGIVVLARRSLAFRKRIEAYSQLPIVSRLAVADKTVQHAVNGLTGLAELLARTQRALADLQDARERLAASASTASEVAQHLRNRFAPRRTIDSTLPLAAHPSTAERIPEN